MRKQDIEALAVLHMEANGLLAQGWTFGFDKAIERAGCCHWNKKKITISPIVVAEWTEAGIENMITHEVAHAIAGQSAGHSLKWQRIHKSLGGDGERLYDGGAKDTPVRIKPKWVAVCPQCGPRKETHRRLNCSCGDCGGRRYNPKFKLTYIAND